MIDASRGLSQAERNYSTIERECLTIVWAIDKFRVYVHGVEFTIITDHNPLVYLQNVTIQSKRITKWRLSLANHSFEVQYKKGSANMNADALSRAYESFPREVEPSPKHAQPTSVATVWNVDFPLDFDRIRKLQQEDKCIAKIVDELRAEDTNTLKEFQLINGVLYKCHEDEKGRHTCSRLVVPESLVETVLTLCHDEMS